MPNDQNASVPPPSAPVWRNWSGNLVHQPASDGVKYYFTPTNLAELKSALAEAAKAPGATVRVSGQRHSQAPLVVDEDRGAAPQTKSFLVDMSCYGDLGPGQDQGIVLGPGSKQVTVNAGVREDELDAFLTKNNLMLTTVTAGGFFSLGGMTAVDVHGGTMDAPIFAETVSAFTLLLADGSITTINAQSPAVSGWSPLQFARVSLGALGVVTSVTIDVEDRPWATIQSHSDLWLTGAVQVIFMSYYIPLPGLDDAGLEKVWDGLDVVSRIVLQDGAFHVAAPMEFRFVKGGDTAMSATFTGNPQNTWFGNLDLIGFVKKEQKPSDYSPKLLQFFADVERGWVEMGGFPHNGKMYGFYGPTAAAGTHTAPFNPNFLADLRRRRGARLEAFAAYRKRLDPNGLFYNRFLQSLLEQ